MSIRVESNYWKQLPLSEAHVQRKFQSYIISWCGVLARNQSPCELAGKIVACVIVIPLACVADLFRGIAFALHLCNGIPFWQKRQITALKKEPILTQQILTPPRDLKEWKGFLEHIILTEGNISETLLDEISGSMDGLSR